MPIREHNFREEGKLGTYDENLPQVKIFDLDKIVVVESRDVIKSLCLAGKGKAAVWIMVHFGNYGADISQAFQVFQRSKGYLLSPQAMEAVLPEVIDFDSVQLGL